MSRTKTLSMLAALLLCAATMGCGDFIDTKVQRAAECKHFMSLARTSADSLMVYGVIPPTGNEYRCYAVLEVR